MVGNVGHTGNSTEPHLHFQLMDSDEIKHAKGLPFVFERYEKFDGEQWVTITNDIHTEKERIWFGER